MESKTEGSPVDTYSTSNDDIKTSERFPDSPKSDIILKSCDNTLFYVHIRNLSACSQVFADANDCVTGGNGGGGSSPSSRETVEMTETAQTLELLLQFIYPQPQPNLSDLDFEVLYPLAEAAEKWKIYAAMTPCSIYIRRFVETHPLEILKYATIHDYASLTQDSAKLTVDIPATDVIKVLPANVFIRWVIYRDTMKRPSANDALRWINPPVLKNSLHRGGHAACDKWRSFESVLKPHFQRTDLACLLKENSMLLSGCKQCEQRFFAWKELYEEAGKLKDKPLSPSKSIARSDTDTIF